MSKLLNDEIPDGISIGDLRKFNGWFSESVKNNRQSVETTAFYATMNLSKRYDNSLQKGNDV